MRGVAQMRVLPVLLAVLSAAAFGAGKKIEGLVFDPTPGSGQSVSGGPCVAPFSLSQEPDQFFQNIKENTVNGSVRFERDGNIVKTFPDELILSFAYLPTHALGSCTAVVAQFDPEKIKFKAVWRNGTEISPADGTFVLSEHQAPGVWCEQKCGGLWVYELRIESAGVPLTDQLEVTVEAGNGSRIAQFTGKLEVAGAPQIIDRSRLNLDPLARTRSVAKP
jgi:hypothetical protein